MNVTAQQRKILWICIGVVVASYVVRSIIDSAMQAACYQQQTIRAAQQRANAKAHPPAPARVAPPPVPRANVGTQASARNPATAPSTLDPFTGIWRGRTAITGRGLCTLTIEVRASAAGSFTGYSTLGCGNFAPLMSSHDRNLAAATLNRNRPAEAILSGALESGAIHFKVDKTIGANSNGCAASSFALTPFGTRLLAAQWTEAGCEGGHVVLQKVRP